MSKETVWIVLFRGVGGATQLPVAKLREALTAAGFRNVATYINSGNALVRTTLSRDKATKKIAAICRQEFGFDKAIYLVSREELAELIAKNPFPKEIGGKFLHAAVLEDTPPKGAVEKLREHAVGAEDLKVVGNFAYLHTPAGFGTSKFAARFDKGIGVGNTARNWNTVLKLMELADKTAV